MNVGREQQPRQPRDVELRVEAGARQRAHVDNALDTMRLQQVNEVVNRTR
jgi:hypothetical protein